jgi:hypothetical protein
MQLSASEGRPFKGVIDCGKYVVAEHGVFNSKGLFRGWTATAVRAPGGLPVRLARLFEPAPV